MHSEIVLVYLLHLGTWVTVWTVASQPLLSMGILQARILERVAMPSSRGSSELRDGTLVSCSGRRVLYHWATLKPKKQIRCPYRCLHRYQYMLWWHVGSCNEVSRVPWIFCSPWGSSLWKLSGHWLESTAWRSRCTRLIGEKGFPGVMCRVSRKM